MKITNKYGLPQALVNAVKKHTHKKADISVTELINPVRQYWLKQRHWDEIEEDISQRIWALLGTAFHSLMEEGSEKENALAEEYLTTTIAGMTLSGTSDLFIDNTIVDFKTTSVYKILKQDYEDWEKQLNIYAYLFTQYGFEVKYLQIIALLRDWSKMKAEREQNYPQSQIITIDLPLWDYKKQEQFITEKIIQIKSYQHTHDNELPLCTDEERWADPDIFAVMKKGRKSALKRCYSQQEAEQYIADNGMKDLYIEHRKSVAKRCKFYCPVKEFCNQYKQ